MRPLEGLRILALEHYVAGPFGSQMLADAGAEVIKIERPGSGDDNRSLGAVPHHGRDVAINFLRLNRNKKSVELDLKSPEGREIFHRLVAVSDVVWENFSPGALERLDLDAPTMMRRYPSLIYASISGFGKAESLRGPYHERRAFDFITQAMSGLMWLPSSGEKPQWLGFQLTDLYPGVLAALGVMFALRKRERTGRGEHVDISMYDAAAHLNEKVIALFGMTGRVPAGHGDLQMSNQLGLFAASDGYVAIGVVDDRSWLRLCEVIGRADLAADETLRTRNGRTTWLETAIKPAVAGWAKGHTRTELMDVLLSLGIASGPVQEMQEIIDCEQLEARQMFVRYPAGELEQLGLADEFLAVGDPVKLVGETPPTPTAPPRLGADTADVLQGLLGMDPDELDALAAAGIVGPPERDQHEEG